MANFNFNKVILGGRLTADPELRQTQSGIPVCSFSIAVSRRYSSSQQSEDGQSQQQTADFINVVAWRQRAEFLCRYFHKGSSVCVVGALQSRSWTDQQGQKRYTTEVVADEINFVDSKSESSAGSFNSYTPDSYSTPSYSSADDASPKFEEVANDDDLPF